MEIDAVFRRFKSKFESEEEKRKYEHNNKIADIKLRYDELGYSDLKHS